MAPTIFAAGASINWLRNHRMATINMPAGNKNALKAAELEEEIGHMRAHRPDPISCRACAGWRRGHVERYVVRRIGKQAQRKQESDAKTDKSDELINSFIFRRRQDAHKLPLLHQKNQGRRRFEVQPSISLCGTVYLGAVTTEA